VDFSTYKTIIIHCPTANSLRQVMIYRVSWTFIFAFDDSVLGRSGLSTHGLISE